MSKVLLFVTFLLAVQFSIVRSQDGFATLGNGTTGGFGGSTVSVCTEAELIAAVADDIPRIVRVTCSIQLQNAVRVGSNKSILGATTGAGISGHGLLMINQRNIIIRGLHFCCAIAPDDGVRLVRTTNVWIDHNEFYSDKDHGKDYYDGLLDVTQGSDFVTISWNKFHDHYKASLVGHSDKNGRIDSGKLHVTYHHNFFLNCHSRLPSIRFGTGHIYNNLYQDVKGSAINSRMGAEVLVESNVFRNTNRPVSTKLESREEGFAVERNNDFGGSLIYITQNGTFTEPPYSYNLSLLSDVPYLVQTIAGATILF